VKKEQTGKAQLREKRTKTTHVTKAPYEGSLILGNEPITLNGLDSVVKHGPHE